MPNDIKKLRRLMRTANYLRNEQNDRKVFLSENMSVALKQAWWFESFRDALSNGFARFTYFKKDGSTRTALGTRSILLIPADKAPKCPQVNDEWGESAKAIPYFDLEKKEWRSFSVINFVSLDLVWRFNDPLA